MNRSNWSLLGMIFLALVETTVAASTAPAHGEMKPSIFEIEPNARYASTDFKGWEVFSRNGVRLTRSVTVEFDGTNDGLKMEGVQPEVPTLSVYAGNDPSLWRAACRSYGVLAYRNLYPGIDLVYRRLAGRLKGDYIIQPGADVSKIRFRFTGAKVITDGTRLVIRSDRETLEERIPAVYELGGQGSPEAHYREFSDGSIGFVVTGHDPRWPLVIDPDLTFSTFLAGSMLDQVTASAYSPSDGILLVTGWTESSDFFGVTTAFKGATDGFYGRFVIGANGMTLSSMTLFGGSGNDKPAAIAVNSSGLVVIGGQTSSSNFPKLNPYQSSLKGTTDGFLIQFSGSSMTNATYFGGTAGDQITGVGIDSSGVVYFAGTTASANLPLAGAYQSAYGGGASDGFAGTLRTNQTLGYLTYLGGAGADTVAGLALLNGEVYLTGGTDSTAFPTRNAAQPNNGGGQDAFVTKLTSAGGLSYSTYLGGGGGQAGSPETGGAIAVDATGAAYVVGMTSSFNFPLVSAAQSTFQAGPTDAFLVKYSPTGSIVFSTYWGGSSWDQANAVTILPSGFIAVAGMTSSQDPSTVNPFYAFPTQMRANQTISGPVIPNGDAQCSNLPGTPNGTRFGNYYDGFVAVFWPTGSCYWSGYLGGSGSDAVNTIASSPVGELFVGGLTGSYDFPLVRPLQATINSSGYHGFISRLTPKQSGLFRPSAGMFYLANSLDFRNSTLPSFITMSWANVSGPDAIPVVGDWDNTGRPRLGLFRSGTWYLDIDGDNLFTAGGADIQINGLGQAGDTPVVGDWDNTGRVRLGFYRNGLWYLDINGDHQFSYGGSDIVVAYGSAGAFPIVGDWTNSGQTRLGIVYSNIWYLDLNNDHMWTSGIDSQYNFGASTDYPVFADWDNSGVKRIGVYRTSGYPIGWWYLDLNGNNVWDDIPSDRNVIFGGTGDIPVFGIRAN